MFKPKKVTFQSEVKQLKQCFVNFRNSTSSSTMLWLRDSQTTLSLTVSGRAVSLCYNELTCKQTNGSIQKLSLYYSTSRLVYSETTMSHNYWCLSMWKLIWILMMNLVLKIILKKKLVILQTQNKDLDMPCIFDLDWPVGWPRDGLHTPMKIVSIPRYI